MHSDKYESNEDEEDVAKHVYEEESVSEEPGIKETLEVAGCSIVQLISKELISMLIIDQKIQWAVCSVHKLIELVDKRCHQANCSSLREINYVTSGWCIIIHGKCLAGHTFQWESSDVLINERQAKIYMDNLYFSAATVLSGNHFHKIKMLSDIFGLHIPCSSTFHAHQRHYVCPGVNTFYLKEQVCYTYVAIPCVKSQLQQKLLCKFKDKSLLLAGDGRCDSLG